MAPVRPNPAISAHSRGNPASNAAETFQIPMNRTNPLWFVVLVLVAAAVVGAILYARRPSAKAPSPEPAQTAAPAHETKEQIAARREHMEITQKSMARAAEAPAGAESAAAKSDEPSSGAAASPKRAGAPAGRAAVASQPTPKAAGPKPVPRKQLDALDKMAEDLAGQLK